MGKASVGGKFEMFTILSPSFFDWNINWVQAEFQASGLGLSTVALYSVRKSHAVLFVK